MITIPDWSPLGDCTNRDWKTLDNFDLINYINNGDERAAKEALRRGLLTRQDLVSIGIITE